MCEMTGGPAAMHNKILVLTDTRDGDHGNGGEEMTWACDATDLLSYLDAEVGLGCSVAPRAVLFSCTRVLPDTLFV